MRIALAATLVLLNPAPALAASCADLHPANGPIGYRQRSAPDRCEGLYQSPVAGEILELLSFVRQPIDFDPQVDKALKITAPPLGGVAGQPAGPVSVVARALPLHVYYRMDAQLASDESLNWPIEDVVLPARLAPGDLGIVGVVRAASGPIFIPVDVRSSRPAASASGPVIIFRPSTDLDALQWRLYAGSAPPDWKKVGPGRKFAAGDAVPILLEASSSGVMTLEVAAKPVGGEYVRRRMQILLP
jgi:hypothetical protein